MQRVQLMHLPFLQPAFQTKSLNEDGVCKDIFMARYIWGQISDSPDVTQSERLCVFHYDKSSAREEKKMIRVQTATNSEIFNIRPLVLN